MLTQKVINQILDKTMFIDQEILGFNRTWVVMMRDGGKGEPQVIARHPTYPKARRDLRYLRSLVNVRDNKIYFDLTPESHLQIWP